MRYTFASALTVLWTLVTWKYNEMDHDKIDSTLMEPEKENEREKMSATLMEQELENPTEKLKPQLKKNSTKLKLKGGPFINPALTAFSLDIVFFLLLIHTFGVCLHISSPLALVELACSLIFAVYAKYKWKRKKAELEKKNVHLQKESLNERHTQEHVVAKLEEVMAELENQRDRLKRHLEEAEGQSSVSSDSCDKADLQRKNTLLQEELGEMTCTQEEVKTELESQRDRLKRQLEEVETAREENKKKLQLVEADITEREKSLDKPQELLEEKQNLLQAQWKLDETKRNCELQMLNIERSLEPIETQHAKMNSKRGNVQIC